MQFATKSFSNLRDFILSRNKLIRTEIYFSHYIKLLHSHHIRRFVLNVPPWVVKGCKIVLRWIDRRRLSVRISSTLNSPLAIVTNSFQLCSSVPVTTSHLCSPWKHSAFWTSFALTTRQSSILTTNAPCTSSLPICIGSLRVIDPPCTNLPR